MWYRNKFFKIAIGIILVLVIMLLTLQILPFLAFIINIVKTFLYPTLFAIVFYYLFRPMRNFLEEKRMPRWVTLIVIYSLLFLFIILLMIYIWPYVSGQISQFSSTPKEKIEELQNQTLDIMNFFNITSVPEEQLKQNLIFYSKQILKLFTDNILLTLSSIAQITSYFILTPFLLFYLLKDDYKVHKFLLQIVPIRYKNELSQIGTDIDKTLSYFITSQVMVASIVGLLIFIGYLSIGLSYVFILAFFAFIFNIIPFTGPFISTVPALLIGLADSPIMGLKVLAVVLIVHLLDLNLISPRIVGQKLNIHPVTIIFLLVASLPLLGFAGLFLITPAYAIIKVILIDLYEIKNEQAFKRA